MSLVKESETSLSLRLNLKKRGDLLVGSVGMCSTFLHQFGVVTPLFSAPVSGSFMSHSKQ